MEHQEKSPIPSPRIDETIEISKLHLRGRKRRVFKHFRIQTVGELLAFNAHRAKEVAGAGDTTVEQILNIQKRIACHGTDFLQSLIIQPPAPAPIKAKPKPDYSEVNTIIESLFRATIPTERNRKITRRRLGLEPKDNEKRRPTLQLISDEFGLTRERIRQIFRESLALLQQPEAAEILAPFWEVVTRHLDAHNGFGFIDPLFEEIKTEFGWQDSSRHAFAVLLSFHHGLVVDAESGTVSRIDSPCLTCDEAKSFVSVILDVKSEFEKIKLSEVGRELMHHCHAHCPNGREPQAPFSPHFISLLAADIPTVDVLDDCLTSRYCLLLERGGKIREIVCEVLRVAGHPLHFREVAEIIRAKSKVPTIYSITDNCVHTALVRSNKICRTARGTYGLCSWNTKQHVSHGNAIIQLLEQKGRPMSTREIIEELTKNGEFRAVNIRAALHSHSRIKPVARRLYSLADKTMQP